MNDKNRTTWAGRNVQTRTQTRILKKIQLVDPDMSKKNILSIKQGARKTENNPRTKKNFWKLQT